MSRKTIITGAVAAVLIVALMSTAAMAQRGGGRGFARTGGMNCPTGRMGGRGMGPSFTSEQMDQIKEIRAGFEDERVELQNKLKVLHVDMAELTESDDPDFNKIERMIDQVTELRSEVMKLKLRQHKAIRAILDEDQRVLFDRGMGRMFAHGGRDGMRGGMRGGKAGGRMGCHPGGMMGQPGAMGGRMGCCPMSGPMGADQCIFMMKGDPEMFDGHMTWETEDGEQIEIYQMPGGGKGERRIIVEKIIEDDDVEQNDD